MRKKRPSCISSAQSGAQRRPNAIRLQRARTKYCAPRIGNLFVGFERGDRQDRETRVATSSAHGKRDPPRRDRTVEHLTYATASGRSQSAVCYIAACPSGLERNYATPETHGFLRRD